MMPTSAMYHERYALRFFSGASVSMSWAEPSQNPGASSPDTSAVPMMMYG